MEHTVISFILEALISSNVQINRIDESFHNEEGDLGTIIFSVANFIKASIFTDLETCDTYLDIIKKIIETSHTVKPTNVITEFIIAFLSEMYEFFEKVSPGYQKYLHIIKPNPITDSDNYVVDVDKIDGAKHAKHQSKKSHHSHVDYFKKHPHMWIGALKYSLNKLIPPISTLNNYDYSENIENGFLICLLCAIRILEKKKLPYISEINDIIILTNVIENLSIKYNTDMEIKYREILFRNGCPNPCIQVLATFFRALIEAIKLCQSQ